jgi:hypothetical protein
MKEKLKIKLTFYEILRILSPSLLDKTPIVQSFKENNVAGCLDLYPQQFYFQGF